MQILAAIYVFKKQLELTLKKHNILLKFRLYIVND